MCIKRTPLLAVEFQNSIQHHEISKFRGAVVNLLSSGNMLFHNHMEDGGLRYSYPLIQYKRIHGEAAIVCIKAGAEGIGDFFSYLLWHLTFFSGQMCRCPITPAPGKGVSHGFGTVVRMNNNEIKI